MYFRREIAGWSRTIVLVGLALWCGQSPAWATHDEPGRGRSQKGPLITAYAPCTAPNTVTVGATPVPACAPPTRSDEQCGFGASLGARGVGKMKALSKNGDLELTLILRGLGLGCEGEMLCATASVRVTTDRCVGDVPCTAIDLPGVIPATSTSCCIVRNGKCSVRTSINGESFDAVRSGERAGIELLGCGMRRIDSGGTPVPTFSCGTLVE